jgi:hypothetical protein
VIRLFLRVLGLALLAGAFAACVIDGARSIADEQWSFTQVGNAAYWAFPNKFPLLEPLIKRQIHPLLWDPILLHILMLPTWAVAGVLGAGLFYLARRRPPAVGHSNRSR